MAAKFHCRKCGKKFIDWGAEKLGYKCPDCEGEELVRVGAGEERAAKKPSLRRRVRKAAPIAVPEEDIFGADVEEAEVSEDEEIVVAGADDAEAEAEYDLDSAATTDVDDVEETDFEVTEDLAFGGTTPSDEEQLEEPIAENEEWPV